MTSWRTGWWLFPSRTSHVFMNTSWWYMIIWYVCSWTVYWEFYWWESQLFQSVELLCPDGFVHYQEIRSKKWKVTTSYQTFGCTECGNTKHKIWQKLSVKVDCTGNVVKFATNRLPTTCKVRHVNLESPRCPQGQFAGSDRPQPK